MHSFTEAIRNELKDSGVTVTSLLPGATDTDFFRKADITVMAAVERVVPAAQKPVLKAMFDWGVQMEDPATRKTRDPVIINN